MAKKKAPPETQEQPTKLTPQQVDFLAYYLDPTSETYGNAKRSALRAKYSAEYADTITAQMPAWFSEYLGKRAKLLDKAERNIDETLDLDITQPAMGMFGPIFVLTSKCCKAEVERRKDKKKKVTYVCLKCERQCEYTKEQVFVRNPKFLAIKADISKFVAETIGKKHYAKRAELGGLDGKDLPGVVITYQIPAKQSASDWAGNPEKLKKEKKK